MVEGDLMSSKAIKSPSFLSKTKNWFKIPYVNVSSVEDYLSLSKEDREWHGLYKLPYALPSEFFDKTKKGWDFFNSYIKKTYPIQYFFRRWAFSSDNPLYWAYMCLYWPFRDFKYAIRLWFNPLHPRWRASLPRHKCCDISELVVTSNFALIRDFYWEEVVDGWVDWTADKIHKDFHDTLVRHVDWIEKGLPELEEMHSKSLANAVSDFSATKEDYNTKYKKTIEIEKEKRDKETEILIWFIENREFFWT